MSIRDVARDAGVSHQTVSRVINEHPNVSDATRETVLASISALGFRPNRAARALAGGPLQSITVLGGRTDLYGNAGTIQGIEEATRAAGIGMGFRALELASPRAMRSAVEYAVEPAGALIVIAFDEAGDLALECVPQRIATAAIIPAPAHGEVPIHPSVWIDEFAAAHEVTSHLLGLGHRTVHLLPIPSVGRISRREEGWRAALEEAGAPVVEPLAPGWSLQHGCDGAWRLVADPAVTAILCGNDDLALGALRAMRAAGKDVPGDVSIVGFDDIPYAEFAHPALTTIRQDFAALGRACVATLLEQTGVRTAAVRTLPRAELIIRETMGPPPAGRGSGVTRRPRTTGSAPRTYSPRSHDDDSRTRAPRVRTAQVTIDEGKRS